MKWGVLRKQRRGQVYSVRGLLRKRAHDVVFQCRTGSQPAVFASVSAASRLRMPVSQCAGAFSRRTIMNNAG